MMTLLPFVYRKFFPFGSPPMTMETPLVVLGRVAYMPSTVTITKLISHAIYLGVLVNGTQM